jgi:hypothetical protein
MKKISLNIFIICCLFNCSKPIVNKITASKVTLNFLDEYIVKDSLLFQNNIVGGLSGIDKSNQNYYLVVDDEQNPRYLSAKIEIKKDTISTIEFLNTIHLKDSSIFYKENSLDLESIIVNPKTGNVSFVSEGRISRDKKPTIFYTDSLGKFQNSVELPDNFTTKNIKHNGAFESSSKSVDEKGFWVGIEAPMKIDGVEPTFKKTSSPVRITYFDSKTSKATKQFSYLLEHISKPSKGKINLNGVTAILEYEQNRFFIIERIYQSGYGTHGNTIKIFDVKVNDKTTNTLKITALKKTDFIAAEKELIFDFSSIRDQLTDQMIDNIEGITFGPKLSNGNQSLLLVSDDNFQRFGKQLNQFILLEIKRN